MAILVILAISTTLALPSFGHSIRKNKFKKDSHEIMACLRGFKLKAVSTGKAIAVSYENQQLTITIQGDEPISKELSIHEDMRLELEPSELYFSPQGWARPATITLQRDNLKQIITIDPLTARPYKPQRQTEPQP